MITQISDVCINALTAMTMIGFSLPIVLVVIWAIRSKASVVPTLVGAATFVLAVMLLEPIPQLFLLSGNNDVSRYILSNPWAYALVGGLLAGVFEETGRFAAFSILKKKYFSRENAISYGLGHGGVEMIIVMGFSAFSYLTYANIINNGQFETVLNEVAAINPASAGEIELIPDIISSFTYGMVAVSTIERIAAMILHVGCSIFVFSAVHNKEKRFMFPLAIVLHMMIDVLAGFYQSGVIKSVFLLEAVVFVYSATVLYFAIREYKRLVKIDVDKTPSHLDKPSVSPVKVVASLPTDNKSESDSN